MYIIYYIYIYIFSCYFGLQTSFTNHPKVNHPKPFYQPQKTSKNLFSNQYQLKISYLRPAPCPLVSPQPLQSGQRLLAARECPPPRWPMLPHPLPPVQSWERPGRSPYGSPTSQRSERGTRQRWHGGSEPWAAWVCRQVNCILLAWSGLTVFPDRMRELNQEGSACRGHR